MKITEIDERVRTFGISVVACLFWLDCALAIVIALSGFAILSQVGYGNAGSLLGAILIVFGVVAAVVGYGLWNLRIWAFWSAIALASLDAFFRVFGDLVLQRMLPQPAAGAASINWEMTPFELLFFVIDIIIIIHLASRKDVFFQKSS